MNRSHGKKWCFFKTPLLLLTALLLATLTFGTVQPVAAALQDHGPISAVNGYPIWYEDTTGLRLDLCLNNPAFCFVDPVDPDQQFSVDTGIGGEAFWWLAETSIAEAGIVAQLGLALESTWVEDATGPIIVDGNQIVLNRIRIRADVPVPGEYIVTHPYGVVTYVVPNNTDGDNGTFDGGGAINETQDLIGSCTAAGECDFAPPLQDGPAVPLAGARINETGASIGPFLMSVAGVVFDPDSGNTYLADPATPTQVLGSPLGTNFFRIQGPNGTVENDLFTLLGQVSGCTEDNEAPTAVNDLAATKAATAVVIDVLANDSDIVVTDSIAGTTDAISPPVGTVTINPGSIGGTAVVNPDNTVTFTPAADFTGPASFEYTVTDPCGEISNTATVTVLVEDLQFNQADLRVRTGKWAINGTSSFSDLSAELSLTETAYVTGLFGAQEVPPVTSAASGDFAAIFDSAVPTAFNYDLTVNVPEGTTFTRAHIHAGVAGANGGVLFTLCDDLADPIALPCTVTNGVISLSGTLTAAEFQTVGDITTFVQAVTAIQTGGTYVNIHSVAVPSGEVRGQIGRNVISLRAGTDGPAIGAAEVQDDLSWGINGKLNVSPETSSTIEAESGLGNTETLELRLR